MKELTVKVYDSVEAEYEPGNLRWATAKEQANNRGWPRRLRGQKGKENAK